MNSEKLQEEGSRRRHCDAVEVKVSARPPPSQLWSGEGSAEVSILEAGALRLVTQRMQLSWGDVEWIYPFPEVSS